MCEQGRHVELSSYNLNYETHSSCQTSVDKKGNFIFKGVPPGKYLVQPIVENSTRKLHITPMIIELEVEKDTLFIRDEFKVSLRIRWFI